MTRQVAERRKTDRVSPDPPLPVVELTGDETPAVLKNISLSGLACTLTSPIPEMTVVEMMIRLPALPKEDVDLHTLKCQGAVVRCEPGGRGNSRRRWLLAIFFTDMDDQNRNLLHRYIDSRS